MASLGKTVPLSLLVNQTTKDINKALDKNLDANLISKILNDHYYILENISEISEISLKNKCAFQAVNQEPITKREIHQFIQDVRQNPQEYSALDPNVLAKECKESKLLESSVLYAFAKYKGYQEVRLYVDKATAQREGVNKFQHDSYFDLYYTTHDTGLKTGKTLYVGYKNQHFSYINTTAVSPRSRL
jgi:hypothetical protein